MLALIVACAAFVGWLRRDSAVASRIYVVQDECAWTWPLDGGDTIYQSLDGRRFSLVSDSVSTAYYGVAEQNVLGVVSEPSFFLPIQYVRPVADSLNVLRDSLVELNGILHQQNEEMEYYHETHSPTASSYQKVTQMGMAISVRMGMNDSLLRVWPDTVTVQPLLWHRRTFWIYSKTERKLVRVGLSHRIPDSDNWLLRMGLDLGWRGWRNGIYRGEVDSIGEPDGSGNYWTDCELYSGDWKHGRRDGSGTGIAPGRIVMSGTWSDDRFRGEESYYDSTSVFGIDISRYQHEIKRSVMVRVRRHRRVRWVKRTKVMKYGISWQNLRITSLGESNNVNVHGRTDFPVSYVYIKATQGTSIASRYYAADAAAARRHGIPVGAYHFFSIRSGVAQARYFLWVAKPKKGDLPPVLDVELTSSQIRRMGGAGIMCREMRSWLELVKAHCGTAPVLYVSQKFVDRYLSNPNSPLRDYPVWIARYSNYRPYVRLSFWQLSPYGRVRGITGAADIDVFNGTHDQFRRWCSEHACH